MISQQDIFSNQRTRLLERLSCVTVQTDPCPHFVIDDALDGEALSALYASLPASELFTPAGNGLQTFQTWQAADDLQKLTPVQRSFFDALNRTLFSQTVAEAVIDRFRPQLMRLHQQLFGHDRSDQIHLRDWGDSGALNIRAPGSALPIHLDWPNRLVSLVLYLAPDNVYCADWGTRLYSVDVARIADPLALMAKKVPDDASLLDPSASILLPFAPGRLVAFMNTPWSYHGADVSSTSPASRWCLVKGINLTQEATEQLFGLPPALH